MTELDSHTYSNNSKISSERALSAAEILHNTIRFSFNSEEHWQQACGFFPEYQEKFDQLRQIILRRHHLADPKDKVIYGEGKVSQIVSETNFKYVVLNAILINRLYPIGSLPEIDETQKTRIANEAKSMRDEAGDAIDEDLKVREVLAIILEGKLRIDPINPSPSNQINLFY